MLRQLTADDGIESIASLWVSGKKTRLAGSDDLRKVLDEDLEAEVTAAYLAAQNAQSSGDDTTLQAVPVPERAVYRYLPRPQLMIYAVEPSNEAVVSEDPDAEVAQETAGLRGDLTTAARQKEAAFIALKIALPTSDAEYNSKNGRVKYVLNRVAQKYWMSNYEELL